MLTEIKTKHFQLLPWAQVGSTQQTSAPCGKAGVALRLYLTPVLTSECLSQAEVSTLRQVNSFIVMVHHNEKN